jgi:hypothetical protein
VPPVFSHYFTIIRNVHDYNIRTKQDIHVSYSKLSLGQRCIKAKAGTEYYLKENTSVRLLKYKLHNYPASMM